jgi:hypothetical protein
MWQKKFQIFFPLEIGKFCSTKHGIYDIILVLLNDFWAPTFANIHHNRKISDEDGTHDVQIDAWVYSMRSRGIHKGHVSY